MKYKKVIEIVKRERENINKGILKRERDSKKKNREIELNSFIFNFPRF